MLFKNLLKYLKSFIRPLGKTSFLYKLKNDAQILDIGCGNNSPYKIKSILPNCIYTGIDIEDYNQTRNSIKIADKYILTESKNFANTISKINKQYDAVICTHNIEHCEDRDLVLNNICEKVKPGGLIYLTFPSEDSINFPSRRGTLNYFDDKTHKGNPPNFLKIEKILLKKNIKTIKKSKKYQPTIMMLYGNLIEPLSLLRNKVYQGTWEKWGFEAIIIGKKSLL